jgi:hypothetical protein
MAAQGGCTAVFNRTQNLQMLPSQPATALLNKLFPYCAEDVGHLERWPVHFFCRFLERLVSSGFDTSSDSRGLATACK